MRKTIRNKNGITMVVLVITLVVLVILSASVVTITKNNITDSKMYSFINELEIIEKKMTIINKEIALGSTVYESIGTKYEDIAEVYNDKVRERVEKILSKNGIEDFENYRYLSAADGDLLKLGLKNIKQDVIISYDNSIVCSFDGLTIDGKTYYSINEVRALQNELL